MKTITVTASKKYDVIIGSDLLAHCGEHIASVKKPCTAAIISDTNVWPLYGNTVSHSLKEKGFQVIHYAFTAGESSKNTDTYIRLLNFLAENKLTRTDLIIALGGGVVGDMAGFVAATYLRGVSYVQIPTSLLAMVDSSVGGKTAIDLCIGKNLVGAFYQPSLVLCDITALNTLPADIFRDGCAEVIKYGVLYDEKLFGHLEKYGLRFCREDVISRCVELKRNVVMEDEYDTGARQKLNLGHTVGHGIEAQSNFEISHGQAVAIGMAIVSKAGWKQEICAQQLHSRICAVLETFGLPVRTGYSAQQLYTSALSDKKRAGGNVNLIVPKEIGNCIVLPTDISQLKNFIEAGL